MIEYVHPNELPKLKLEIAKPNRNIIGRLPEAFNIEQNIKLGQINELSFTIPYEIEKNFTLVRNPNVDKLKSRYLVRVSFKDQKEWFIISNLNNSFNEDGKAFLNVKLYSLGYQLKDKKIRTWAGVYIDGEFRKESLNAQQVLENLLSETTWRIDYIDSEFLTKYRSFDFNNTTVLDAIFEVARTFNGILKWNTENKTISLLKQENVGVNKGFRISYGKYLKSLSKEEKSDEMITRLHVYGKDGLSIHRVNPLGTDYIEDFSYFMQGFQRDKNKNTISSSEYMSDGLCHALLDYQEFVAKKDGKFQSLILQKESLESQKKTKENELTILEMELKQIQDTIDVKQTSGMDASAELQQEQEKLNQIAAKKAEIDSLENQINNIDTQIEQLKNSLSIENHLTPEQIIELNDYIIEETWEDQNYYDDVELYNDAKKVFEDLKKPKTIIDIDIVNLFKLIEAKNDWDKVQIGDKFYIHYEKFGIDVESQIIEMDINHDDNSISVTIANTVDIERDEEKLSKILYDSISVKSTIDMSKYKWDQVNNVKTSIDEILEGKWNPAINGINAGVNNTVTIDRRGITITSSDDPNKFVRMTNGVIGFTNDGGNTFKLALDATGVYAEHLVGKITITKHLYIENASGKYRFDQYGMTIDGGSLTITNGLPESQINPTSVSKWNSAEQNAKNYVDEQMNQVNQVTEELQSQIDAMSSDNKLTLAEANVLKSLLESFKKESTDLINIATSLNIATEKNNYNNAIITLENELNNYWINQSSYPLDITNTQRNNIKTLIGNVQNTKSILVNKIMQVRQQNAQQYADSLKQQIDNNISNLQTQINNTNNYIDGAFKDDIIEESEAKAIQQYINILNAEKADIDNRYSIIYNNPYLRNTTIKNNLSTAKSDYDTKHSNLINAINNVIADGKVNSTEKTNVNTAFSNYKTSLGNLSKEFENAIDNIAQNKANDAENNAKSYVDTQIDEVNTVIDNLQSQIDDFSSDSKLTLAEANALEIQLAQVKKESMDLINIATSLGITTEKNNYNNAITDLDNYLTTNWINKTNYPLNITTTDRDTIKSKFETVQNTKSILINKIASVQSQDGKNAWSKFSGIGNTLPAGNVEFNFAGSTTKGGNAINTDNVGNQSAIAVQNATINFNNRNDRKSTPPADPTIATNETAVDHTINNDGSADISFEWSFNGTGDAYDIDGFIVYVYQSTSSSPYTFGTTPSNEQIYVVTPEKRAFILYGVPADRYYTFGIQAYRIVDQDINPNGILKSSIVKPTVAGENPYRPTSNIAFAGDITGTVNGIAASTITTSITNFNKRNDRKSTPPANPTIATDGTAIDHTINTDGSADISFEWSFNGSGDAYDIDGFIIYVHQSTNSSPYTFETNTSQEQVFYVTPEKRAFILYGVPADRYYTFGVQAYRIVDPDINSSGILKSSIVKSNASGENPYQPSSNVSFSGNVTGTINGTSASTVVSNALNALQQGVSYNNVKIDTANGLVATRSDDKVKAIFNATDGIKVQVKEGSNWTDKFYFDATTGNLNIDGIVNARDLKVNGQSVLTTNKLKINGGYIDKIKVEQLDASTAKITTAMIETLVVGKNVQMSENAKISWSQVSDKPYIPQTASDIGALPNNSPRLTYIDANGIYTGTISANQITAGTISANKINGGTLSGVTINVDTDAKVGNNLYLGSYSDYGTTKRIYFNDRANISGGHGFAGADIQFNADTLWLNVVEVIFGDSVGSGATVDFTGCTVKGLNVVAKFR